MKNGKKICEACGAEVEKAAKNCPNCGAKIKKPIYTKWWFYLILVVVLVVALKNPGTSSSGTNANTVTQENVQNETADAQDVAEGSGEAVASESTPVEPETEATTVSKEYQNALKKAESYSRLMHMSKQAIYDQLVSEYGGNFPADAAQYAIDNLKADYCKNALEKAKSYSETMHMSKAGIYDQLISEYGERFTKDEAQYAVDHLNVDYKQNALEKAKSYQDMMNMSKSAIYDQLISQYGEQFTADEAQYAIDHLD